MKRAKYSVLDLPERLRRRIRVSPITGCWLWQGCKSRGYGHVCWQGRARCVHRLVYTLLVGKIKRRFTIDHVRARGCVNRHCCNPAHLEPVLNRVNILRGNNRAARQARKVRCLRGHLLSGSNLTTWGDGHRRCRKCHNARKRMRYYQKHREEINARRRTRQAARRRAA